MVSNSVQFYINTRVEADSLVEAFSQILNAQVETLEYPNDEAQFFLMESYYDTGFPTGINLSWNSDLTTIPQELDTLNLAQELAKRYQTWVVTDLPESDPDFSDPYIWCMADPNGCVLKVTEDTSQIDDDGLLLDMSSQVVLEMPKI